MVKTPIKAALWLQKTLQIPQNAAQKLLDKGRLELNGEVFKNKAGLLEGEVVLSLFVPHGAAFAPIFFTRDFAAFDKPPKLLTHPRGRFEEPSLLDSIRFFSPHANAINRLDFETSGILLASLNKKSEISLKNAFLSRRVAKIYLAIVRGQIASCTIDSPLFLQEKGGDLFVRSLISPLGKPATTHIKALRYDEGRDLTLVFATPITGRTHQIRAHLASAGHRILGEPLYGVPDECARAYLDGVLGENERLNLFGESRLFLHSLRVEFELEGARFALVSKDDLCDFRRYFGLENLL